MIKTRTKQQLARFTHYYFGNKKKQTSIIEKTNTPKNITHFINLSYDSKSWAEQVNLFLQASSPESYENAKRLGRLDEHIKFIVNLAKEKFDSDLKMGLTQDEAIKNIKQFFLTKSTPILPTPQELIDSSRNAKPLSVQNFEDLSLRYSLLLPEDKFNFIYNLMTAIMENPSFAALLTKTAFVYRFAKQELYLYCLGAYYFGIGNLVKATEIFKEGVTLFPTSTFYLCLANCYRAQGEWEQAKNVYLESLEKYPTDDGLKSCLAGTAFAIGDISLANSFYTPSKLHNINLMEMRNKELQQAIASNQLYRDEEMDIYDDAFANTTWWNYWYHFNTYTRHQNGEGILADIVPEYLDKIFQKLPTPPKTFIELGTMCGEIIYRMASLYPQTIFFGIDRHQNIKNLNDEAYSLPNLEFAAADI
ncbi:TPA: tetratricopeptide repeat protein, partial [Legionella pneumophila]|nr:tetratricopeptide repeat protein [Legionella pneumophila]